MIRRTITRIANIILPPGSSARHEVRKLREGWRAQRSDSLSYEDWIKAVESNQKPPTVSSEGPNPLISIVIPAFNTPDKYLNPLLNSVIGQSYSNWELVLVQASTDPERAQAIRLAAQRDERIKVIELEENKGIAGNTNAGITAAQGDFIAFTDHDDVLAPHALAYVVVALQANPRLGMFYSDEDKISDGGTYRSLPLFKPGWSPELFLSVNYLAHFIVVRTDLVREVGGIRLGYDGAQDYDFLLRIISLKPEICAIARMSYHWRQAEGSTGLNLGEKSYATDAGLRAMENYVSLNKIDADVTNIEGRPTEYRLKYRIKGEPSVAVLQAGTYETDWFDDLAKATEFENIHLISDISDAGEDELILHIDTAVKPAASEWLSELIGIAQQPDIAWAGAGLVSPDGRNCGIGYTLQGKTLEPIFSGVPNEEWTYMGPAVWPRNVLIPNLNCALIEAKKLKALDADNLINSAVLAPSRNLRNAYWPYAKMMSNHELQPIKADQLSSVEDHCINPNLSVVNGKFVLRKS